MPAFSAWYARLVAFNVEDLFSRKRPPGPPRTIHVNEPLPADYHDHKGRVKPQHVYTTNQVITSKYTVITFLPRNLLEQFRRVANMFFLGIAILQFFPKFSTLSPGVVIIPLLVIWGVTALKDGYEDVKRHQTDRRINHTTVSVLAGAPLGNPNAMSAKSKTFVRGLLPKSRNSKTAAAVDNNASTSKRTPPRSRDGEMKTTDFVELSNDVVGPHWKATAWEDVRVGDFVKIMDNESFPADILICATSEDENVAFIETKNLDGETNLKSRNAVPALAHLCDEVSCADVQNAFQIRCDRPENDMYRLSGNVTIDGETSPVDLTNTLLRGTVLRNTSWIIGVVLFTGLDTKIVLNSGGTPSKRSKVERQMNPQVFTNLALLGILATVSAIADSVLEHRYYPRGALWLYNDNQSDDNPKINGLVTWAFSLLTYQDIVPISLYISIEFVRTCQAAFIYFDADIWYAKTNQATLARSWNLSDDLGQIEYIFSDKTGTLTQNQMVFRQCSIGGVMYYGTAEPPEDLEELSKPPSISHDLSDGTGPNKPVNIHLWNAKDSHSPPHPTASTSSQNNNAETKGGVARFRDFALEQDIAAAISAEPGSANAAHARHLNGFFTVLALCHSVLTAVDPVTGMIEYKAQSPDESALVQAAADMGYAFLGRNREILTMQTPTEPMGEKYELLNILEFTSARKRMSVVVRKTVGDEQWLFLLTKGADNVIFERLKSETAAEMELKEKTERDLSEFAKEGLRTLTLAFKRLQEDEYQKWSKRYREATVAMENREALVETVSDELEQNLRLLGATAIEDRLQDGVPETIADLKRAGIKIWVATGDKLETAVAIGRSTNLIAPDSNIVILRGGNKHALPVSQQIELALQKVVEGEPPSLPRPSLSSRMSSDRHHTPHIPLQRIDSGVSSIVGEGNGERPGGFVLVIDGPALVQAFETEENKAALLRLATQCEGVICCRVSPLQKALIVKLVKNGLGAMTLAIGDGANDVSMIQAADVGVGISGEEGLQAANSSDYAIAQFRFLKKLLLVHGHWSYARNGTMILNFFYKNIVPVGVLWWFQIYDGWSASFVFDYIYVLFWNSLWTILPVIGIGLFDRFLDAQVLMDVPELYHFGRTGQWFSQKSFLVYIFDGIVQSAIIYFIILYTYTSPTSRKDGYDVYQNEFSTTMAISAVMIANFYNGLNTTAWTAWLFVCVAFGIVVVWVFTAIYAAISPGYAVTFLWGNNYFLFHSAYFWLCLPITFCISLAPRFLYKAYKSVFAPDDIDIIRWVRKYQPTKDFHSMSAHPALVALREHQQYEAEGRGRRRSTSASRRTSRAASSVSLPNRMGGRSIDLRVGSRTDMSTGLVSVDRGFDFAMEEGGVAIRRMQTNLSEARFGEIAEEGTPTKKGKETFSKVFSLRKKKKAAAASSGRGSGDA